MTFGAGDASGFMGAAAPVSALSALMASEADRVVLLDLARRVVLAERNDAARAAPVRGPGEADPGGIGAHGSVSCALRLFGGEAGVVACDVPGRIRVEGGDEPVADHDRLASTALRGACWFRSHRIE